MKKATITVKNIKFMSLKLNIFFTMGLQLIGYLTLKRMVA